MKIIGKIFVAVVLLTGTTSVWAKDFFPRISADQSAASFRRHEFERINPDAALTLQGQYGYAPGNGNNANSPAVRGFSSADEFLIRRAERFDRSRNR